MNITNIYIEESNNNGYLKAYYDIILHGKKEQLWFEFEKKYREYFDVNRVDGILVMFLNDLLLDGEKFISKYPISSRLKYQITNHLIPNLVNYSGGRMSKIIIDCPSVDDATNVNKGVSCTGISFGIDSLYSFLSHTKMDKCDVKYQCKLVSYFNHGALNGQYKYSQNEIRNKFLKARSRVQEFSEGQGIDYITIDTNLNEKLKINYTCTNTYRTCGLVLLFQKLIKNYYYASSYYGDECFSINPFDDSSHYDLYLLPLLSTERTQFYSVGVDKRRNDKLLYIVDDEITKKYLSVCWNDLKNCGKCNKCIRTIISLEILKKIDDYLRVFDVSYYKNNYIWIWAKIWSLRKSNVFCEENCKFAADHCYKIPFRSKIIGCLFAFSRKIIPSKILHKIQKILKH